ncbi:unnamed protein product [Rhizoctonia solani]|uniref:Uncharacterized protein n=1 Tax=Rhizoctonia solani TaxID=456999 RepID=A0A8H3E2E9_9AGAM|nr:unnamed protein product [Rhizoctonia solani]CAE7145033.1 unnamed protein product [Rhizoctonia solani]
MVRRPFSPINIQRRRPRPAALDLAHSTFSSPKDIDSDGPTQIIHITHNGPYFCGDNDEHDEQARASAELAHTQALFSASLESEPIPGVRARSPTAYRTAGKSLPMEVEINISVDVEGRPSLDDYRLPLPTGDYKFPPTDTTCQFLPSTLPIQRPLVETPRRNGCVPLSWVKIMRALRRGRISRRGSACNLPEPLGFRERIAHAEHEWRPHAVISCEKNKGRCLPQVASDTFVDWPWR